MSFFLIDNNIIIRGSNWELGGGGSARAPVPWELGALGAFIVRLCLSASAPVPIPLNHIYFSPLSLPNLSPPISFSSPCTTLFSFYFFLILSSHTLNSTLSTYFQSRGEQNTAVGSLCFHFKIHYFWCGSFKIMRKYIVFYEIHGGSSHILEEGRAIDGGIRNILGNKI